jgi:hypothetical protein
MYSMSISLSRPAVDRFKVAVVVALVLVIGVIRGWHVKMLGLMPDF